MAAIVLSGVSKNYGDNVALQGIDLEIPEGEVFGYLGPNGAGKTTTLRILVGLLRPTSGTATVLGYDAWREAVSVHANTGYVPGEPGLWERLTGEATVEYLARLRGDLAQITEAHALADRLGLDLTKRVRALSKGNKQKLVLVAAFMSRPQVAVLDEPTTGLDPLVQQEFHTLVREMTHRGGTVLLSSHLLDDVQRTAQRVGIIREGRLVSVERLDTLRSKAVHHVRVRFAGPFDPRSLTSRTGVSDLSVTGSELRCRVTESSLDAVVKTLAQFSIADVEITEADLEEMFLAHYGAERGDAA